ncbi:polyketide cyclase/dehydrase and lipid transporter [Tuber brumale]|nr:polyketide cyclase/dehydrase and lipid transporter [Tuber brumale]
MPPRLAIPRPKIHHPIAKKPLIHHRHFFPLPTATPPPQRFTTSKSLPYPPRSLFSLVADINAYHKFLPYCAGSRVTRTCPHTHLPTEAELRVAWGSFDETFSSIVTCSAEAGTVEANGDRNGIFERLVTRWVVKGGEGEGGSVVSLFLEFGFRNPIYAAVSAAVAPKVAGVMIEAFERRAGEVLGAKGERVVSQAQVLEGERAAG